jgi:NADH-quinone oxidoreductase subunit A
MLIPLELGRHRRPLPNSFYPKRCCIFPIKLYMPVYFVTLTGSTKKAVKAVKIIISFFLAFQNGIAILMQFLFLYYLNIMLFDFGAVLLFIILAVIFVFLILVFAWAVRPSKPSPEKSATYECGERPAGDTWIKFNIHFYIIALIFIIFEVEILVLFPWAMVFKQLGLIGFIEMLFFVGILLLGLFYLWKKGDLSWVKKIDMTGDTEEKPKT